MGSDFAVGGLASGLPADMVDQLMATKQQRLQAYERDVNFFTGQKSAFGELKTKLLALSSVSETLQDTTNWSPHTASSTDTDAIDIAADSTAVAGTHSILVSQLASSNTVMSSGGVTDDTDTLSSITTFSFDYNGQSYTNTDFGIAAGATLADITTAIGSYDYEDANGDDEDGISASILYDGTNYRLVLSAKDQGAYVRDSDGSTTTSRISNFSVDLSWTTSGNTWDTSGATASSGISTGAGLTDATATLSSVASGVFNFTYNGVTYDLSGTGTNTQLKTDGAALTTASTMQDVADAITDTVTNMTASVVNDGTNNYLVIDGSTASQGISAVTTNFSFSNSETVTTTSAGFFTSNEGQDARLTVDGLANIYSSSNVVDEVLPGVTLTVKEVNTTAVSVTVADDADALTETLDSFTSAYNDVIDYINTNRETVFSGSTLARSVISQMRSVLNSSTHKDDGTGAVNTPYSILAELGLRTDQSTGKISFNSSTLSDALANNFTAITNIFTNTQTDVGTGNNAGVAYRFEDLIDEMTSSTTGSITGKDDGLQARLDSLATSIDRENRRLEQVRARLSKQFTNLEVMVNSMNASGSALTSALSGL